jgi:uncharacterized protein YqeY
MLRQRITDQLKEAMKAKDKTRLEALRYLLSLVKNKEIDKKGELTDEEIVTVAQSEIKKRKEAIELFRKGGREELVTEEEEKLKVLAEFLPEQMSKEEIERKVDEIISGGTKDFGAVMKAVMGEIKGKADGKLVSEVVRERLAPPVGGQ